MVHERRKRKFIDSWAQLSIALEIILHALLLVVLISLLLFAPPFVTMFSEYSVADHQAIAKNLFHLNISKWPLFLGLSLFIGAVSILFSHHIVGPAYQLHLALEKLNERNLQTEIRLRKWDYLRSLEDQLNRHVERLRDDFGRLANHQKAANGYARDKKQEDLEKELSAIGQIIGSYRLQK